MAISHKGRLKRKPSGGLYTRAGKKKLYELGRKPTNTLIGVKHSSRIIRVRGGNSRQFTLVAHDANLYDPKSRKHVKAVIKTETGNPANVNYVRRNILTKGSIVDTDKGKARITSRPGQHGSVEAVLI
ncbi:30S ribosomal protein S8e [Candidatus Woesearchaeota archaeon]|nr:30S ribosomal protein S8e [Candidatus Woesearchaeota archaeon]